MMVERQFPTFEDYAEIPIHKHHKSVKQRQSNTEQQATKSIERGTTSINHPLLLKAQHQSVIPGPGGATSS